MAEATRVEITLLGQTLSVRTEAPPDYVRRLAGYVERRVQALKRSGVPDPMKSLMLAALDITDELFRVRDDLAKIDGDVGARLGALVSVLERAMR
jgi:cell division protein ZapA (FtsZ GTPase activity inhibitor)